MRAEPLAEMPSGISIQSFATMMKVIPIPMMMVDKEFALLHYNSAYTELFTQIKRDSYCKCFDIMQYQEPCENCPCIQAIKSSRRVFADKSFQINDSLTVDFHIQAAPIHLTDAHDPVALLILENITHSNSELQLRSRAEKFQAQSNVLGHMAHDINNLLTGIVGYSSMLLKECDGNQGPHFKRVMSLMKGTRNISDYINKLLALHCKQPILSPINLNQLILGLQDKLQAISGPAIHFKLDLYPDLPIVDGNQERLEDLIVRLVLNSIEAQPFGGQVNVSTLCDYRQSPKVELRIADNGIGIDPEDQTRIFEPFFSTKKDVRGRGLGLPIIFNIVMQHNGKIESESKPGVGTVFKVHFPALQNESKPNRLDEKRCTQSLALEDATIMVIEDDAVVRDLISSTMRMLGCRVLTAGDFDDAIELVLSFPEAIQLLISDVILPRITGPTLYDKLLVFKPSLKVLYISGWPKPDLIAKGILTKGDPFVGKPFSIDYLVDRVREALSHY